MLNPALTDWLLKVNAAQAQRLAAGQLLTPISAREALAALASNGMMTPPVIACVDDAVLMAADPVPLRIYHPAPEEERPLLVFCHGGGHVAGSVAVYDALSRRLAWATGCVVVTPEYRLAPENPYPAALQDMLAVWRGVRPTLSARGFKLAAGQFLAGDSGGAAVVASMVQQLKPADPSCRGLILLYPSLDYRMVLPSVTTFGAGYLLEAERMAWYFDQYFRPEHDRLAASPLLAPLPKRHPPVLLLTAGFDPLHDEGLAYAQRLAAAGVGVDYVCAADMIHAFLMLDKLVPEACEAAYAHMARFVAAVGQHQA